MKKKNRKGVYKIHISATYKRLFELLNNETIKRQKYAILCDIVIDKLNELIENLDKKILHRIDNY